MKKVFKFFKRLFLVFFGLVALFVLALIIFVNVAPQIGQEPKGEDLARISQSPNYKDGIFVNIAPTTVGNVGDMWGTLSEYFDLENGVPSDSLPVQFGMNSREIADSLCAVTWYGHSAFLIEMGGKKILIDPMLSDYSAPIRIGSPRFPYQEPIPIDELKEIDILILSHDHYDHLDYETIMALSGEVKHYYTALGVGSHLKHWGVAETLITELDWWEEAEYEGIKLIAAPSRHFSGRGLTDRFKTQWASWIISSPSQNLYFSGDGGYGNHFVEIGERYGPFDLAMLECGQYNEAWSEIHMMPEQSVQAGIDVKAELVMPIHWGAFQLAIHEWTDPILRFKKEAQRKKVSMIHPYIGQRIILGEPWVNEEWWVQVGQ